MEANGLAGYALRVVFGLVPCLLVAFAAGAWAATLAIAAGIWAAAAMAAHALAGVPAGE